MFNASNNNHGERYRVILLTAEKHSEGITLKNTRRLILADLSPGNVRPRWTLVQQRMGRALRMCQHNALQPQDRTLSIEVFVVKHNLDSYGFPKTLDQEKYDIVRAESDAIRRAMNELRDGSLDAEYYRGIP